MKQNIIAKIYQGQDGKIYLKIGNGYTSLTIGQIKDLYININSLKDFSQDAFNYAYLK